MEKRNVIIPWISICCLLLGMYTGFATEFNYGKLDWWFLASWTVVLSAAAVFLVLQWKPWISGLLTVPALILAGLYGYSHREELEEAVDAVQMLLSRQMAKYNGTAVLSDAPGIVNAWESREYAQEGQLEMLFLLCGFFVAVYLSIVTMRLSFRIYGLILPYTVVFVGLSVGASPGVRSVFLLFAGTALALYWVEHSEADSSGQGHGEQETGIHLKVPWALAVLCLCIVICAAASILLNSRTQERILAHAKETLSWQHKKERQLKEFGDTVVKTMKARFGVDNDGKLDNDAPEYGDKDVLLFTMDSKPTEDVYLRGFVGNVYGSGRWTFLPKVTELEGEINRIVGGKTTEEDAQKLCLMELDAIGLRRTSFKGMNELSGVSYQVVGLFGESNMHYPEVNWKIEYVGAGRGSGCHYHPYFDQLEDTEAYKSRLGNDVRSALIYAEDRLAQWQIDRTLQKLSNQTEGKFYYMSIQQAQERADIFGEWSEDYDGDWSALSSDDTLLRDDVLKAYLAYARKEYTKVPEYLTRFTEFADNQGIYAYGETAADIAVQIRSCLWGQAAYSKQLKAVPENEDYVEYFLLEQKKGFCEHFATAGTLLFRHYGIPAKFVTGYRIPVEAFKDNGDGTYTANVQDSYSHAWSEVLIGGLGWYPMEMTPGAAGVVRGQYDEETEPAGSLEPTREVIQTATPAPTATASPQAVKNSASPSQKGGTDGGGGSGQMTPVLRGIAAAAVFFLLCLSVWAWCRYSRSKYSRSLKKLRGKNSRAIRIMTEGLLCFLTDCGMKGCERMTEKEWIAQAFIMAEGGEAAAENPSGIVPVEQSDMVCMQHSIEKAFFANEAVTFGEYEEFLKICDTLTEKIIQQMTGWHRFTILLFGWRKQFAEWKKLCYDRTE